MPHLLSHSVIEHFLAHYGYWAIFVLVGLENGGVPLPGEIVLISAAIIAGTTHELDIGWVVAAAAGGGFLGANFGYWLGSEFGFRLLLRHGRVLRIGEREMKLGEYLFLRHGGKVVFFGRLVAVLRMLAAILAGVNRMPWPKFLLANAAGGILWAGLYGLGGFVFGKEIHKIAGPVGLAFLGLAVVLVVVGLRYVRHHQRALEDAAERAFPGPVEARHRRRRERA